MAISVNDRDTLRLISAFQEINNRRTRRAILLLLEELAQKEDSSRRASKGDH
jgi:hypothetical protein